MQIKGVSMDYNESLAYISSFSSSKTRLGLDGMRKILNLLGAIDQKMKFVHIAGTNGKGSTCKMIESILISAGYKTGLFISPYIIKYNERMQVNSQMINDNELAVIATQLKNTVQIYIERGGESPNEFEITTLLALMHFSKSECDIVCFEVGLGGLLDPTNVIDTPLVSVITSISLDHTAMLGDNLSSIAVQKCGIIKGGITVAYPKQESKVFAVINSTCERVSSKLITPKLQDVELNNQDNGNIFKYRGVKYSKKLYGKHQIYNAVVAIEVAKALTSIGYKISDDDISSGIYSASIPARQEIISYNPIIMIDGSHNPDGALALSETLDGMLYGKLTVIMAVMADKDISGMINIIAPYADLFIAVGADNARSATAIDIASKVKKVKGFSGMIMQCKCLEEAIKNAKKSLLQNDMLLICGSLYLAGEARAVLKSCKNNAILDT